MGRPDSELYRGSRLTQALEWRDTAEPVLTAAEAEFLAAGAAAREADRRAADDRARQHARGRRRTRLLVAGVAALLVAAVVAAVVAVRQQRERDAASLSADTAEAARLIDLAHNTPDVDRAALLSLEGFTAWTLRRPGLRSPACCPRIRH